MKRRMFFGVLIIAFIWIVISRYADVRKLFGVLSQGQIGWIIAAIASQFVYYLFFTILYHSCFDTVEVRSRILDLIPVVFGSVFLNAITPASGMAGTALFIDDASRRGESPARAAVGSLLVLVADLCAFSLVLLTGLLYLFIEHDIKIYQIVGASILLIMTLGLTLVVMFGLIRPVFLRKLLVKFQHTANRLVHFFQRLLHKKEEERVPFLKTEWAEKTADEFIIAANAIASHPRRLIRTLIIAIGCHLVDLVTITCLFLAFHYKVHFGALVAGYAIGIVFWFVAITPQGIGVVEGAMALTYASMGVPPEIATIVPLGFRGLTFWFPLVIGFVLLQRVRTFGTQERTSAQLWNVRVVAIVTGLMGVINILSGTTPALASRLDVLRQFTPLLVRRGSHLTSVLAGFALIILASGLWRRKRVAWIMAIVVLVISIFSNLLKGLDYEEAALAAGLVTWLLILRDYFHARSDRPSIEQGLRFLVVAFLFTLGYGVMGFYFLDRHFATHFGLFAALRQTVIMFTQFYDPGLQPITGFGRYFASSIYVVGAVTFGYALFMLVRPVLVHDLATPAQRSYAAEIVRKYGCSPIARFTLLEDKAYYFTPGGTVFAYVVKRGIALVLGDPIGPDSDFNKALNDFKEFCSRNDWQIAFYQAMPDNLNRYRSHGFQALCVGHEAIVDLNTFTLEGRTNKSIRSSYNRLAKLGYQAEFYNPPLSQDLLDNLHQISDEWLTVVHGQEKRFSVGWFDEQYVSSCQVITICSSENIIVAFANIVPEYQRNEASIDMMRHLPGIENGTMEFLFVSLMNWARDQGYASFNLGLSALSGIGEKSNDPAIERALRFIYDHINQFYNFQGLHQFKDKFHPQWSPRYLIYPNASRLPAIALAMMMADSGDNFLVTYFREMIRSSPKPDEMGESA